MASANPKRHTFLLRTLEALRDPAEGMLPTDDYATLLEAFMTTREASGRGFTEEEFFGVVEWADLAVLRSRWFEDLVAGRAGIDLADGPVLCVPPSPEALARAATHVLEGDETDLSLSAALRVFVAGRLTTGARISADELTALRAWCVSAMADRALLDLALGYPALGLDLTPDGRVTLVGAGTPL